jgi:hypothetical protein
MKQSSISIQVWVITALFGIAAPRFAKGDGGIVQLREAQGPFSVTVFVSSEAPRCGLADVSVLVQWREGGEAVLDADVSLTLNPPGELAMNQPDPFCGLSSAAAPVRLPERTRQPVKVRATREQASNKLLYAAAVELNDAGDWHLHVLVSREADSAGFDCILPVTMASAKSPGLWPYLAFPPIAITAFAMNQRLRRHSLEKGP